MTTKDEMKYWLVIVCCALVACAGWQIFKQYVPTPTPEPAPVVDPTPPCPDDQGVVAPICPFTPASSPNTQTQPDDAVVPGDPAGCLVCPNRGQPYIVVYPPDEPEEQEVGECDDECYRVGPIRSFFQRRRAR
ncbi:MAG: hypothetical protein KKB31_08005 [Nanoarchaeota archaeon]|nr:hypothetical protein [Nanoarchaeota archaeon]